MKIAELSLSGSYSGIAVMIWSIYKNLDTKKNRVDIITLQNPFFDEKKKEIENNGSRLYSMPSKSKNKILNYFTLYQNIKNIAKREKYNIVHIHGGGNLQNIIAVKALRNCGAQIIMHAHNEENAKKKFNKTQKKIIAKYCNKKLSCSDKAADAFFRDDDWIFIKNGIDTEKFSFSQTKRTELRRQYKINDDEIFVGTVGRMEKQKNHEYLIDIFKELTKNKKAKLVIVGNGSLKNSLIEKIHLNKLDDRIILVDRSNDIPGILSALDYFVLPSLYEGLPVSAIESQANGLTTII